MQSILPALLLIFAANALAAPGSLCKKGVCNADNCLRAVRATSASPFASSATADCSSFFRRTVTPCVVTSTTTKTTTLTASAASVTVTTIVPQTNLNTVTELLTSVVTTVENTLTITQPTVVINTQVIVTPVTVTGVAARKRAQELAALPTFPAPPSLAKRTVTVGRITGASTGASTCAAATGSPTRVPTYASACSGTVRYSSACSCAGITPSITTLTAATTTVTSTSTVIYTPTTTLTATLTSTIPVTVVETDIVPVVFATTDATLIIPDVTTEVVTVVIPTTVVVAPPVCSSYKFVVTSGNQAGQFITGDSPDNSIPYGFVTVGSSAADAITFTLRSDGTVYSSNVDRWITRGNQLYYVLHAEDMYAASYNIDNVYCTINSGTSSYPNAAGQLTCTSTGHAINFYSCPSTGNNLIQGTDQNTAGYGCTSFSVAAILAC